MVYFRQKLDTSDLISLTLDDIAPHGFVEKRGTIRQRKTGRPVTFEISELSRSALDQYLKTRETKSKKFLFPSRVKNDGPLSTRQYARLVSSWISNIGLNSSLYGTHSLRRTKASLIYRKTGTQVRIFGGRSMTSSFIRRMETSFISRFNSPRLEAPVVTQP